jgi:hypothetical protein
LKCLLGVQGLDIADGILNGLVDPKHAAFKIRERAFRNEHRQRANKQLHVFGWTDAPRLSLTEANPTTIRFRDNPEESSDKTHRLAYHLSAGCGPKYAHSVSF